MASIFNHTDFWHLSGNAAANILLKNQQNLVVILAWIQGIILCAMSPLITFGNAFVVFAVWKDPLRKLRSSPSNFILQSMAVADLFVGLVLSPLNAYWILTIAVDKKLAFPLHVTNSLGTTLVGASLAHLMLLSMDRFCAVVTPLRYKAIITCRRVNQALFLVWCYFICFGIAAFLFENKFFIISLVFGIQMVVLLNITFDLYIFILYQLYKYNKLWKRRIMGNSVRVCHRSFTDKEMNLAKRLMIVIAASLFVITPFCVLTGLVYFCIPCYSEPKVLISAMVLESTFTYLNSVMNPFMFCWRLEKYKQVWKCFVERIFQGCTKIKKRFKRNQSFDTKL
ncbi:histamine H2 receptor-like [Stylophora pistillata]|uniref:histamine H2 receptor-like n=1 Tax=Stylophora pistillata TaxID=50429 RepID=UPI000C04BB3F|nr:histamine H2 receptor-like [Stylophora pistillata]